MRKPAACAAGEECDNRSGSRPRNARLSIGAIIADDLIESESFRHYFLEHGAVTCANSFGLRPPGGDRYCQFRMSGKPDGDGLYAVGPQFAVDVSVQFIVGHG